MKRRNKTEMLMDENRGGDKVCVRETESTDEEIDEEKEKRRQMCERGSEGE